MPYYGTIDATPLWLILLHETWRWTGDDALVRELLPNAERALDWIDRYGDIDGDGFVEYCQAPRPTGLVNQGWKDSGDGVPFPDGRLPEAADRAGRSAGLRVRCQAPHGRALHALGDPGAQARCAREASRLRERIMEAFWIEELGTFALALDGAKRPLPTVTTNAGHLLWCRVPDAARAAADRRAPARARYVLRLGRAHPERRASGVQPDELPQWLGLAARQRRSLRSACRSRRRRGPCSRSSRALYEAALCIRYHRLPELFCGMSRAEGAPPGEYPVSCSPQAWASGAFFMLLQAATGILPDAPGRELHIREPLLPPFLRRLVIDGMQIGGSRVSLQFTPPRQKNTRQPAGCGRRPAPREDRFVLTVFWGPQHHSLRTEAPTAVLAVL